MGLPATITFAFAAAAGERSAIRNEAAETAFYFGVDFVRLNLPEPFVYPVAEMLVEKCIREVSWRYLREAGTHRQTISNIKFSRENIFEYGFLRSARMAAERDRDGSPVLLVDFESLFNDLYTTRPPRIVVSGSEPGATRTTSSLRFNFNKLAVGLSDRDQITATQVLEQSPRNR